MPWHIKILIWSAVLFFSVLEGQAVFSPMGSTFQKTSNEIFPTDRLITNLGYPVETHRIETAGGYVLVVHRIPYGRYENLTSDKTSIRPSVILQHGNFQSSANWVLMGHNTSLGTLLALHLKHISNAVKTAVGFILADAGYDVWITNLRGNSYSNKHAFLDPKERKYWNFSFHEMGTEDLPATIDYILGKTKQPSLYFVGYCLGSTVFFAGLSMQPDYNSKIKLAIMLSPAVLFTHAKSPFVVLSRMPASVFFYQFLTEVAGVYEIQGTDFRNIVTKIIPRVCNPKSTITSICDTLGFAYSGPEHGHDTDFSNKLLRYSTEGSTSAKTFIHLLQGAVSNDFRQFDYKDVVNFEVYGDTIPPDYPLWTISTPVAFFWSAFDWLSDPQDVTRLARSLPNLVLNHQILDDHFTHNDFLYGHNAYARVYKQLLALLKEYDLKGVTESLPIQSSSSTQQSVTFSQLPTSTLNSTTEI